MRLRRAAVAATSVLSAGAAAVAAGRYAADRALRPGHRGPDGGPPLPAGFGGPPLTVRSTGGDRIALTYPEPGHGTSAGTVSPRLPGVYGLTGRSGHVTVGPVLEDTDERTDGHRDRSPHARGQGTVVRALRNAGRSDGAGDSAGDGGVGAGSVVRLTPQVHVGDPGEALGLAYADAEIPGELGPLPAWFVPGSRSTWVIAVHGLGATREQPLAVLPFLHGQQLPVLTLGYRGDPGAPRPLDGLGRLGASEWRDLDAAIRYAVRYGAERVVLHGWSSGATMALHAAADSALRGRISGLVLDSPVLDRQATFRALAAAHGTPRALLPLAVRAAQGRTGATGDRLAAVAHPARLTVPTLVLHGPDDTVAPWETSQALAESRPDLVTLHTVPDAPHAAMWNADPEGYEEALRRFLTPLM